MPLPHRPLDGFRIAEEWAREHGEESERAAVVQRRVAAISATAGSYDEDYPPGYLDELRRDWPA